MDTAALIAELRAEAEHTDNLAVYAPQVRKGYYTNTARLFREAADTLEGLPS